MSCLFLNQSASTPNLVKSFLSAGERTDESIQAIGAASDAFFNAIDNQRSSLAIKAFDDGFNALKHLETSASMTIIPPIVHKLAQQAKELGGAFKTTGAGGGDIAIGLFDSKTNQELFDTTAAKAGLSHVPLKFENLGVHPSK